MCLHAVLCVCLCCECVLLIPLSLILYFIVLCRRVNHRFLCGQVLLYHDSLVLLQFYIELLLF